MKSKLFHNKKIVLSAAIIAFIIAAVITIVCISPNVELNAVDEVKTVKTDSVFLSKCVNIKSAGASASQTFRCNIDNEKPSFCKTVENLEMLNNYLSALVFNGTGPFLPFTIYDQEKPFGPQINLLCLPFIEGSRMLNGYPLSPLSDEQKIHFFQAFIFNTWIGNDDDHVNNFLLGSSDQIYAIDLAYQDSQCPHPLLINVGGTIFQRFGYCRAMVRYLFENNFKIDLSQKVKDRLKVTLKRITEIKIEDLYSFDDQFLGGQYVRADAHKKILKYLMDRKNCMSGIIYDVFHSIDPSFEWPLDDFFSEQMNYWNTNKQEYKKTYFSEKCDSFYRDPHSETSLDFFAKNNLNFTEYRDWHGKFVAKIN